MASDLLFAVTVVGCWGAAAYRLRHIRQAGDRAVQAALVTSLTALGLAALPQIAAVSTVLDRVTTVATYRTLTTHGLVLIAAYAARGVLVLTLAPNRHQALIRMRHQAAILTAALLLLAGLVLLAPAAAPPIRIRDGALLPTPTGLAYTVIYSAYLGIATFDIARMAWRYARISDRAFMKLGMLAASCGTAVGTTYTVVKTALVVGRLAGIDPASLEHDLLAPLAIAALLLVTVGCVLPALSGWERLHRPVLWLVRLWTYLSLRQLWVQLVTATDVPKLLPTTSLVRATAAGLSLQFLLQRRVTEISDGLLQIRTYRDPGIAHIADEWAARAGLATAERHAVVEASSIGAALRRRAADVPATEADLSPPPPFSDLDRKAWWLQQVGWQLRHSPVVRRLSTLSSPPPSRPEEIALEHRHHDS